MNRLITLLLLLLFSSVCYARAPELPLNPTDERIQTAWFRACTVGGLQTFKYPAPPATIVRRIVIDKKDRVLGIYFHFPGSDNTQVEQILIYVLAHEDRMLPIILFHEDLHAVWVKLTLQDPKFFKKNPDSEKWVCSHIGACF